GSETPRLDGRLGVGVEQDVSPMCHRRPRLQASGWTATGSRAIEKASVPARPLAPLSSGRHPSGTNTGIPSAASFFSRAGGAQLIGRLRLRQIRSNPAEDLILLLQQVSPPPQLGGLVGGLLSDCAVAWCPSFQTCL